jgi:beta-lactamase class A
MYEINNMKLRYTLIGVLCFSINIVLQAQQQALEGKIAGFLKGKKATVGVAVLTDKDETILHNNEVHYPLLSVFKFHVALAVLDKMNREKIPLKHIVHVKASQLQPNTYSPLRQKHSVKIWIYHWESFYNTASR